MEYLLHCKPTNSFTGASTCQTKQPFKCYGGWSLLLPLSWGAQCSLQHIIALGTQPLKAFNCLTRRQTVFPHLCKFFKSEGSPEHLPLVSASDKGHQCLLVSLEGQPVHSWQALGRAEDIPPPPRPLPQYGTVAKTFKTIKKIQIPALEVTSNIWYFVEFLKLSSQNPLIPPYFGINIFCSTLNQGLSSRYNFSWPRPQHPTYCGRSVTRTTKHCASSIICLGSRPAAHLRYA